jgi:chromosome segregation ATPase
MTESGGGGPLAVAPPGSAVLSAQELFQLQQYIREAAHREQMMRSKLEQIDALFTTCHASADSAWQALIDEDRLLSRIEMLENQLELYKKKNVDPAGGDTRMRDDLERMLEEKYDYEQKSKEMLRRAHQENIEAAQRLTDAEQSLASTEKAVERLTDEVQAARSHIATLDTLHAQALAKLQEVETERAVSFTSLVVICTFHNSFCRKFNRV